MSGLLGIGQSALLAAYAQLQTTGHNIANAATPGYSVQQVSLATSIPSGTGGGYIGSGVDVVTVERRYDRFLAAAVSAGTAAAAADGIRAEQLGRVDSLLADTQNGIGAAIDDLYLAMADVVNRPADPNAREVVLARADSLAAKLRGTDEQLRSLAAESGQRLEQMTVEATDVLASLARLNEKIALASGAGHAPNDLLDERDRLVRSLNGYLTANVVERADGTVTVTAAGGEPLLVGSRAASLRTVPDPASPDRRQVAIVMDSVTLPLGAAALGGGALAGLLAFRDEDLQAVRTSLGQLAAGIAAGFNAQQALGVDANGAQGQPMFAIGASGLASDFALLLGSGSQLATGLAMTAQAASGNAGDLSVAAFAATGPAPMSSAPVTFTFNADGSFDVSGAGTGDPAGVAWTPGSPIVFNGWSIELRGTPQAGDRIEVVPTPDPSSDNRNARAMVLLADQPLVDGRTLTDAFASMLGEVGRRTRTAETSEAVSGRLLADAEAAQANLAGVNLDEEAARLLQYQQMYQAAARVIQAAQSMFDTLLSATAR
jgi:flagellar hook-associated protein 1 FlgK